MSTNCCCTDNWADVEATSKAALNDDVVQYIEQCMQTDEPSSQLISVLHKVQEHFGYINADQLDAVAQLMQVPTAKVSGVATFYHYFRLKPRGEYIISVCLGTACYVKGAERIAVALTQELGIDFGETTGDGVFSLEATRCLGTCGLAPVIMVNEEVHGKVTPEQIPLLLNQYMAEVRAAKTA